MTDLYAQTMELKRLSDHLAERYAAGEGPVDRKDHDFFQMVKKETMPLFEKNDKWLDTASAFVKDREVKVHPNQVQSTHENIELLILHSFYLDVKKKRYNELHHSVHYVLDMILTSLSEQEGSH
ncbi:DUF1798 family protein [Thalassobacillus pellis]|uniref:DUF1798 family protein n=1 Tax=Thalassobacillus pellis TaxID=748008 RepID=UPI0019608D95|nr:DUF1798 family protein [Thalassobacillus pellis]MBM7552505.1 hypothetical protein [Thalassobacillus pellis]